MHTDCHLENLQILFQDESVVAIHKPAGLLVHRSPIDKHETHFAVQLTRERIGQKVYPVHRLDKATSGILLFALSSEAARHLGQQFMNHRIVKTYQALCRGWTDQAGQIDHPLKYQKDRIADKHKRVTETPQPALTDYRTLRHFVLDKPLSKFPQQRYSLVELTPKTGRKHQLRRHLNHIHHPIVGDVRFGDRHHNHLFYDWLGIHRLYLAATRLQFSHPITAESISIQAALENSFATTIEQLAVESDKIEQ